MKLFDLPFDCSKNLLPQQGEVYYYGKVLNQDQADYYFQELLENLEWRK